MSLTEQIPNQRVMGKLQKLASDGFQNAAKGFSGMLGQTLTVISPKVCMVPLLDIPTVLGGPENDAVGIYLHVEGSLTAQVMLIIPFVQALEMVDMVLDLPSGTTEFLGSMERSALGEIGNLTGSFFLNAISDIVGTSLRPSPPAVMVDMVGAILDVIIATMGEVGDQVMMFQAKFMCGTRETHADFWVIPDTLSLGKLLDIENSVNG